MARCFYNFPEVVALSRDHQIHAILAEEIRSSGVSSAIRQEIFFGLQPTKKLGAIYRAQTYKKSGDRIDIHKRNCDPEGVFYQDAGENSIRLTNHN